MAYGITSESDLIDYKTIKKGCEDFVNALNDYIECAKKISSAGDTLGPKAISVEKTTYQESLYELASDIIEERNAYASAAEQLFNEAVSIYNSQIQELNEYYRKVEAERKKAAEQAAEKNNK